MYLCPLCRNTHDKTHNAIKYELINYICDIHNCRYNSYCEICKSNICMECEQQHQNHRIISFGKMLPQIYDIRQKLNELRKDIDEFNNIKEIANIINVVTENLENLYKINNDIINNYDVKNINYEILQNINNINNTNINIIKDLNQINKDSNIINKFKNIFDIYNKMNNKNYNDISINNKFNGFKKNKNIIYNIEDFTKPVTILNDKFVQNNKEKCYIIYNNKKYKLNSTFKFEKNGPNEIELYEVEQLKDLSYMFCDVYSIKCFNFLSNWDVSKIENLSHIFQNFSSSSNYSLHQKYKAYTPDSLPEIDLNPIKYWDVSNVENMSYMFSNRKINSIKALEKWDLFKVKTLEGMFEGCYLNSLEGIEYWTLFNCSSIKRMFSYCKGFISLTPLKDWNTSEIKDFSHLFNNSNGIQSLEGINNWDTSNAQDISYMFYGLSSIKSIEPLRNWNLRVCLNFERTFWYCESIEDLAPLNHWIYIKSEDFNILKGRSMNGMFENCLSIKSLEPLKDWNLIDEFNNFNTLFYNCTLIKDFTPILKWQFNAEVKKEQILETIKRKDYDYGNLFTSLSKRSYHLFFKPKRNYGNLFD